MHIDQELTAHFQQIDPRFQVIACEDHFMLSSIGRTYVKGSCVPSTYSLEELRDAYRRAKKQLLVVTECGADRFRWYHTMQGTPAFLR